MQGLSKIFQHLEHFFPLAFVTKTFTLFTSSNLKSLSSIIIGFALAFDAAWKNYDLENDKDIKIEEKIQTTFEKIKTHPFLIENPIQSKEIAFFRIKLLGLS